MSRYMCLSVIDQRQLLLCFFLAVLCRSVFTPLAIIAPSGGGYFSAFEPFVFLGPFL